MATTQLHSLTSLVTSITKHLKTIIPPKTPTFPFPIKPQTKINYTPLTPFTPHLTHTLVIQVIKTNKTSPYHALFFFNWATHISPQTYTHNFHCYIAIVDTLLSHRLLSLTTQFLESNNMVNGDFMVAKLVRAYGQMGNFEKALGLFYRAKGSSSRVYSFNALLGVLVKAFKVKLAEKVFNDVVNEGVIGLDVWSYCTMIRGYCKVGRVEDACRLFDQMPCSANRVTYNVLVDGLVKKGRVAEARVVVDKMIVSEEDGCVPDVVTYTSLIHGYCMVGEMEEAVGVVDEMVERGCCPNVATYNAVVNGFCSVGKVDEAKMMMTKMRLNGVKDDVVTHTSLLKGFCVSGRLDDGLKHLRDMISLGMKPDVVAYGVVVNECCKVGKTKEALDLLKDMKARGVTAHTSTFKAVLKVLIERGELDDAVHLLRRMPEDMGCVPNFLSYFTVISRLCETDQNKVKQVKELLESMLHSGHKPNAALYSGLNNMFVRCGDLEMAIRVAHDAVNAACMLNLHSSANMGQLCLKGRIREGEEYFEKLSKIFHNPDQLEEHKRVLDELVCTYSVEGGKKLET